MKKIIIIILAVVVIGAGALIFLMSGSKEEEQVICNYVPGDYFVTNIKDSTRLLKATIVLELTTDKENEYLSENNHIIRDVITFALREQTEQALRSSGIEDILRDEIVVILEEKLEIDYIQTIYFNDFVIQ